MFGNFEIPGPEDDKPKNRDLNLSQKELDELTNDTETFLKKAEEQRKQPTTGSITIEGAGKRTERFAPGEDDNKTIILTLDDCPGPIKISHSPKDSEEIYSIAIFTPDPEKKKQVFSLDLDPNRQLTITLEKIQDVSEDVNSYRFTAKMSPERQKETSWLDIAFRPLAKNGYRIPGM